MSKNNKSVDLLIDKVREYPILYSKIGITSGSVNNDEKNQAWIAIAREINEKPDFLKKRWRNLRDSYQKAVRSKKDLEEMGQTSRYHPYIHEDKMSFLLPHILQEIDQRKRKTSRLISTKTIKKESPYLYAVGQSVAQDVEYLITEDCDERIEEDEQHQLHEEYSQNDLIDETASEQLESETAMLYEDDDVENLSQEQKYNQNSSSSPHHQIAKSKDDDIDAWLSMIRGSIVKLSKLNRAKAKRDINTILSNYEIEQYEKEN